MKVYLTTFNTNFTYAHPDTERDAKISRTINSEPTKTAKEEYLKAKRMYDGLIQNNLIQGKIDKTHKIYLFLFTDIEKAEVSVEGTPGDTLAFSRTGNGTAFIFTGCISHADVLPLITHELGHAICLNHPFISTINPIPYIEEERFDKAYIQNEINKLELELRNLTTTSNSQSNLDYQNLCNGLRDDTKNMDIIDIESEETKKNIIKNR